MQTRTHKLLKKDEKAMLKALNTLDTETRVVVTKTRVTARHCANRVMACVCHSRNEVFNFFMGKVPVQRRKLWYDVIDFSMWFNRGIGRRSVDEQKKEKKSKKKGKEVAA